MPESAFHTPAYINKLKLHTIKNFSGLKSNSILNCNYSYFYQMKKIIKILVKRANEIQILVQIRSRSSCLYSLNTMKKTLFFYSYSFNLVYLNLSAMPLVGETTLFQGLKEFTSASCGGREQNAVDRVSKTSRAK